MADYIVVQVMDRSFMPIFETNDRDEAQVARKAAQRASSYETVILYADDYDGDYCEVLTRLGAVRE